MLGGRAFSKFLNRVAILRISRSKVCKMSTSSVSEKNIVWVDLEMTGLDINKDHIIEIACLVTNSNLDLIAEGPNVIIHQPDEVLKSMGEWCQRQHCLSGLTAAVMESKVTLEEAEKDVLSFVQKHVPKGKCPLAGNSIHADRMFLNKYMPNFLDHLHYRVIDVSTVKELGRRWYPEEFRKIPQKQMGHRALDDIRESVKELQYYRKTLFKGTLPLEMEGDKIQVNE